MFKIKVNLKRVRDGSNILYVPDISIPADFIVHCPFDRKFLDKLSDEELSKIKVEVLISPEPEYLHEIAHLISDEEIARIEKIIETIRKIKKVKSR